MVVARLTNCQNGESGKQGEDNCYPLNTGSARGAKLKRTIKESWERLKSKASVVTFYYRSNKVLFFIGGVISFVMMLNITANVFGRYILRMPIEGSLELTELLMIFLVFCAIAQTEIKGKHIKVTILTESVLPRFSNTLKYFAELLAIIVCFIIGSLMAWGTFKEAVISCRIGQQSMGFPLPVYPGKVVIFLGFALLCVAVFLKFRQKVTTRG